MKFEKVNIGIVGFGNIGSNFYKTVEKNKKIIALKTGKFPIIKYISAKKLNNPIEYNPSGKIKPLYGPRFAKYSKLIESKNFDDLWYEE